MKRCLEHGHSIPLGPSVCKGGVNFSIYSKNARAIDLLFFNRVDDRAPSRTIRLNSEDNKTFNYWHIFVPGIKVGQIYGYRVHGPFEPGRGLRFDSLKVLLDPYGKAVAVPENYSRGQASIEGDNGASAMKSVVADPGAYDWQGDEPLRRPFTHTIIYEMHVRGFTRHPSSRVTPQKRGTYAGLVEKIPYLSKLGITAVELLPVYQFDAQDAPLGFVNYWGYAPVSFFAPHAGYSSRKDPLGPLDEFRDMVKALHKAGIEVILDVVYNHTAEGNHNGPTQCFRGIENETYYILEKDKSRYSNFSGCGNSLNANNPVVRRMILDSLRYWVKEMHVDGFRFDLASILSRDEKGHPLENPPVLWDIDTDPALAGIKIIAEAWDCGGLYQVGSFIGDNWQEWNGHFRDDVRSFFRSDKGTVSNFASRLLASPDIYDHGAHTPERSINFVTCHDGFTLNDLVSYNEKHNQNNGENNKDGSDKNISWNCGHEGETKDAHVEALRNRQVKNFFTVTLLSLGVPMFLMGDELRRSQQGNNNAYGQDNQSSWLDWKLLAKHSDVHRFVLSLINARLQRDISVEDPGVTLNELLRQSRVQWHGIKLNQPDWSKESHSIAMTAWSMRGRFAIHIMANAYWQDLKFELPYLSDVSFKGWHRWIDTSLASPDDISSLIGAPSVASRSYKAASRSVVVLAAGKNL
ncbi:MAG: glycogen debranching protein GlgX [Candidatus Omnitrophota bacterium]